MSKRVKVFQVHWISYLIAKGIASVNPFSGPNDAILIHKEAETIYFIQSLTRRIVSDSPLHEEMLGLASFLSDAAKPMSESHLLNASKLLQTWKF